MSDFADLVKQLKGAGRLVDSASDHQVIYAAADAIETLTRERDNLELELSAISAAIGDCRYMDSPDGGDVSLAEQVSRMREDRDRLRAALKIAEGEFDKIVDNHAFCRRHHVDVKFYPDEALHWDSGDIARSALAAIQETLK